MTDDHTKITFSITPSLHHMRLDVMLAQHFNVSRMCIKTWIIEHHVLINDQIINKPATRLQKHQMLTIHIPSTKNPHPALQPQHLPLDIQYEDNDILVICKPAGLVVHPGAGNLNTCTLVHALRAHCHENLAHIEDPVRPGIVHRLDKNTSGLMVIAKTNFAHYSLMQQLQNKSMQRHYTAFLHGIPNSLNGKIQTLIGRDRRHRQRMSMHVSTGKTAITSWNVTHTFLKHRISRCVFQLSTGRTHQIRVHAAQFLKCPLIADATYGGCLPSSLKMFWANATWMHERQALHAHFLRLQHPRTHQNMEWSISLAPDMQKLDQFLNASMKE